MNQRAAWAHRLFTILISLGLQLAWARSTAAEISGTTWTSDQFGVEVTWDDSWFLLDVQSEEYESITLTNGATFATLAVGPDFSPTAESALAGLIVGVRDDPTVEDFELVDRGTKQDRAFAIYTFIQRLADGTQLELAAYLEARLVVPGETALVFYAFTPLVELDSEMSAIEALADAVELTVCCPPPDEQQGAAAPVFVASGWRIAVAASILNAEIPDAGLDKRPGNEWLVVLADVTNWGPDEARLSLRDFRLSGENIRKPLKVAPGSTKTVAGRLDIAGLGDRLIAFVAPGETARLPLVFLVPDDARALKLSLNQETLPLADTLQSTLDLESLPVVASPPELVEGEIESASDGRTIRILLDGEDEPQRIRLLGVKPPDEASCHQHAAENLLDDLAGSTVLVEADAAVSGEQRGRYVWLINDDGSRTLLNHRLIVEGRAEAASLPREARFGRWLESAEDRAREAQAGLWAGCDNTSPTAAADQKDEERPETYRPISTPTASS